MNVELQNCTAIVTGAGRGIGAEIARTFAAAGADVVAAARTESEIEATVEVVESHGVDGLAVPTDLTDVGDIDRLVDRTVDTFGTPEVLVNNAGANLSRAPVEQTPEEVGTMLGVNLRGLFVLTQRFARRFRESDADAGRVVNVSSIAAHVGVPAMAFYGGTKAAINGLTRGFAGALADDGVTVNSVSPGLTRVGRTEDFIDAQDAETLAFDRIPLDRVGRPEDVADACLFLASDHASYITGEDLRVDGGVGFTAGLYR